MVENGVETVTVEEDGVLKTRTVNGEQQALQFWCCNTLILIISIYIVESSYSACAVSASTTEIIRSVHTR